MKRTISAVLTGVAALTALVAIQGCGALGGPPTGVAVSAGPDSDSTVLVSWTTPAEGASDKYVVYFRAVADSGFAVVGETTATSFVHNPHGVTGQYKVSAVFGGSSYDGAEKPTTVPIHSVPVTLSEINLDSIRCGFGWARDSGIGGVFGMIDTADSAHVDFYVSDFQPGFGKQLSIASPNMADSIDSGAVGIVPRASWRINGFSNPLADPQAPLPPPDTVDRRYKYYLNYTGVNQTPCYIAFLTAAEQQKHFALIQVDSFNVASGRVWLQTWYQLVPGLTLIRH